MGVTLRSDKRFRRNQAGPGRRRRLRRRPIWSVLRAAAGLGLVALVGYRTAAWASETPWLRVTHVTIAGNERLSKGELLGLLDGLTGECILLTDAARWRERVLASPWVAEATVSKRFPSTVEVVVRERHPIGIARLHDELYLVDAGGTAIDQFGPRYGEFDLPIIDGLLQPKGDGPPEIDRDRSGLAARVLASIRSRPELSSHVSQIDVSEPEDVRVILDSDPAVVRLGSDRFAERLQAFVELSPAIRQHVPEIDYVDLRIEERVAVKPSAVGTPGQARIAKPPA